MVKVECDGCKAPYQLDERRIPPAGLKMRCPKCGTNFLVMKPGTAPPSVMELDLPMAAPARVPGKALVPPPPPPPPPSSPEPDEELLDLPMPSSGSAARGRPSFGQLDFGEPEPLPAVNSHPTTRLPPRGKRQVATTPRPAFRAPPAKPAEQAAPAPRRVVRNSFGQIDVLADLPAPPMPSGLDLDMGFGDELDASPAEADMAAEFGEVDLPEVHGDETDLPSFPEASAALPAVHAGRAPVKPRGRTVPFGGSLPDEPAGLPATRRAATAHDAQHSFGELDLPLVAPDAELPLRAPAAGLPAAASSGLPAPVAMGLPAPVPGGGMPAHVAMGLPAPVPGGSLPAHVAALGLPAATGLADEPYGRAGDARRSARTAAAPPSVGEELSLNASPPMRGAFDDSDRALPAHGGHAGANMTGALALEGPDPDARGAVGDEVDLSSSAPGALGEAALPPRVEAPRPAELAEPTKRKSNRKIALATAVALAVGGASLAFEPSIGAFGVNFISDQVNASKHAAQLVELRAAVQADLDEDTSAAAGRALQRAREAQAAAPRFRPTAAYCAYVTLARALRFGHRGEDEALARQLLAAAEREPSAALSLARAAEQAVAGRHAEARAALAALGPQAADDPDAAATAGEIELGDKDPQRALAAWRAAQAKRGKPSARALYGLARAEMRAGDAAAAVAAARAAIDASPRHASARILLGSLLWQIPDREGEALDALKKVTDDTAVRGAASDAEVVRAYTALGNIHLARSRISAAEQAFAAALKIDPQSVDALVGNGELFYRAGRNEEASARFEAARRADDGNVAARVGVAKAWLALERMKEAKDLLKKVREGRAEDPAVAYWLGRAEEALGNKKEAEAAYTDAIKAGEGKPEVVDAYVALARLLSGSGRAEEANQKLLDASQRFPDLPALHRAKGDLLLQMGRYEEAKGELSIALAREDDLGTRFKLGVAYRRMRAFDDASAVFDAIAAVDKDYPGLALERGLLFEETGKSDRALEMYSDALRKAPNDVDLKLRVGSAQVMAGHAEQAEATLREVVKLRPNSAEANHFLGRALLARGTNLTEAMRFLEAAVSIDGNRAEYHLYVGWCANEAGQTARAESALKRALELDRDLADAYWQRGVLLQKQGATVDALADLKTALEKRPSRYEAYATMALCYQDQQSWAEAEQAWRKAIAGNGSVAEWHYRLGKLLTSHGKQAAAGPELEQAVTLAEAPGHAAPGWLYDAHFLFAESIRGKSREKAVQSYRRFLELAPRDNAYVSEAQRALASLGAASER